MEERPHSTASSGWLAAPWEAKWNWYLFLTEDWRVASRPKEWSAVRTRKECASRAAFHSQQLVNDLGKSTCSHNHRARAGRDTTVGRGWVFGPGTQEALWLLHPAKFPEGKTVMGNCRHMDSRLGGVLMRARDCETHLALVLREQVQTELQDWKLTLALCSHYKQSSTLSSWRGGLPRTFPVGMETLLFWALLLHPILRKKATHPEQNKIFFSVFDCISFSYFTFYLFYSLLFFSFCPFYLMLLFHYFILSSFISLFMCVSLSVCMSSSHLAFFIPI